MVHLIYDNSTHYRNSDYWGLDLVLPQSQVHPWFRRWSHLGRRNLAVSPWFQERLVLGDVCAYGLLPLPLGLVSLRPLSGAQVFLYAQDLTFIPICGILVLIGVSNMDAETRFGLVIFGFIMGVMFSWAAFPLISILWKKWRS